MSERADGGFAVMFAALVLGLAILGAASEVIKAIDRLAMSPGMTRSGCSDG